ncbi:hypothetical protein ACLUWI_02150 [Limosilactobacillus mucosae]|uniref:hypothetical protein n=1 Tax=Limosilactobacillus mucosae TaxID=97478 RepID=UPI003993884E
MAEETNPLTSLLKHKYGIKSPSTTLRFTEKDTLITKWRKTAQFIFKNGDWSDQDYKDAILTYYAEHPAPGEYVEDRNPYVYKQGERSNLHFVEDHIERIKNAVARDTKGKSTPEDMEIYQVGFRGNGTPEYFVIDQANHLTSKQGESYHFRNDPSVGSWKIGNANLTIGYAKLHNDVLAEFDKRNDFATDKEKATVRALVGKRLAMLAKPQYAKEFPSWFQTTKFGDWTHEEYLARTEQDPRFDDKNRRVYVQKTPLGQITHSLSEDRWHDARISNQAISFLNDYLNDTYNVVIEQRYERDLDKQTHARAWEQKKQINKETRAMMDKTQLKQYFKDVELDNDVDLDLYKQLSPEMMRLLKIMPAGDQKPILRLRKLGNYKAKGMYVPSKNTLVVDFRRPGEIYQNLADGTGTAGYTSFVHEYGHYLDRHLTADDKPLSIQPEFRKILQAYQRNFDVKTKGTPLEKHAGYFKTPTEVFARAFEVYTKQAGLKSNLIADSYHSLEYRCIDTPIYQDLKAYFDKLPGFENLAKDLNQDLSVAKEQMQPKEPAKTSERQPEPNTAEPTAGTQEKPAEKPAAQGESVQSKPEETVKLQEKFLPSDDRQNTPGLADYQELKKFAVDILDKWTQTPERLEKLIDATGSRLLENNPNRVIEFDQWQTERLPHLVSKQNLQMMEVDPAKYKVASIRGFEALPLHKWQSSELYDLDALLNQADHNGPDYKQLQKLEKMTSEKEYDRMAANVLSQKLEQSGIPDPNDQTLKPVVRLVAHITRHELQDALTEGKQEPFKFTPAERDLLKKTPAEKLKGLYLSSTKSTQTFYNQIAKSKQQELAPTRSFAKPKRKER